MGLNETFQSISSLRLNTQKRESDEGFQEQLGSNAVPLTSGHLFHLISASCMNISTVDLHRWILLGGVFLLTFFELISGPQATVAQKALEALKRGILANASVSTLDAAIIVFCFIYGKNNFALNSLLEDYALHFWSV